MTLFVRSILLILLCSSTFLAALAQDRTISGRVTSADDNQPIPGASVVVRGSTRGTTTDANGNFRIPATRGQVLRISFIGTTTQDVTIGNADVINVALKQEANALNEVVVTALGIEREKRQLGYAVTEVAGQDLANSQRDNFLNAIQGRVAGVQVGTSSGMPGSSSSVIIRGINSLSGNNQPLYVVDGMPISNNTISSNNFASSRAASGQSTENRTVDFSNRAQDINPNDIETITILKGPEAAALYGVEAANGAIVITTKKGRSGQGRISYTNSFTWQQTGPLPKTQRVYGQGNNGVSNNTNFNAFGPRIPENDTLYNNAENFLRTGTGQRHNLSFDGGTDRYTYRLSAGYTSSEGVIPTTDYKRLNITLGGTAKLTDKLSLESTIQYINTDNRKVSKGANSFLIGMLSWPVTDDMSNYLNPDGSRRRATVGNTEVENPYFDINKNLLRDRGNRVVTNVGGNYTVADWLTLSARVGLDAFSTQYLIKYHPESNRSGGVIGGALDQATDNNRTLTAQYFATLKRTFGKLDASLLVGQAIYDYRYEVLATRGEKFLDPNFTSINNTDPLTQKSLSTLRQRRLIGAFANATFDYDNTVTLTLTGRNDWSSTFPIQNRSFFYPSASLSFVFTELLPDGGFRKALSYGKLRFSAAQVGKEAPEYATTQAYENQTTTGGGFSYGFTAPNPVLRPEKVTSVEVGTELKFFNGRFGIDAAYYRTTSIAQIIRDLRISYGTGFVLKTINGGKLWNNGIELSLTAEPIRQPNFGWNTTINFTKTDSRLEQLAPGLTEFYNSDSNVYSNIRNGSRLGGPLTTLTGNSYLRNTKGDILISPLSGLPLTETVWNVVADRNPDFVIGFLNSFRYHDLSLNFLFDIRKGGDVYNATESYLYRTGLSTKTLDRETPRVFTGVLKDGLENSDTPTRNSIQVVPYYNNNFYTSLADETFIERDINWVRLKEVTVRYNLPTSVLGRSRIFKSASVFFTGNDLFLLTNYTGGDPGVNAVNTATGGSGGFGIDFGNLPLPRVFNAGINIGL
ncbi:TonB-linked SusC/RagA family outer membrane protein [Spirosoma lacussanchae]|uniref:SusC/RagA family TonB-linked outer membrane protein n=1 Tax=Spirosoma lacussanchae TaxID=1884249 RepID=UPI001108993B|nr:SusC/RagA family TonB-linked outer membrane protein [Spirosoma lacussanchae]